MVMFNFIFKRTNGDPVLPKELINLLKVAHRPVIPPAQEIVNEQTLGDGTVVYQHTGVYEDRVIEVECNFIAESKRLWHDHLRQVQNALVGDTGTLSFSDDSDHYFKVKRVDLKDFTREYGHLVLLTPLDSILIRQENRSISMGSIKETVVKQLIM